MGLRLEHLMRDALRRAARLSLIIVLAWIALAAPTARAADSSAAAAEAPAESGEMTAGPAGWLENIIMGLEHEPISDVSMHPIRHRRSSASGARSIATA